MNIKERKIRKLIKYFLNCFFSWILGLVTLIGLVGAFTLSQLLLNSDVAGEKVQKTLTSMLSLKSADQRFADGNNKIKVEQELDNAIESFFKKIIKTFISSWYANVTQDENFVFNIKLELTEAIRTIAHRVSGVSSFNCICCR